MHNVRPQLGPNCLFGQEKIFWKILPDLFFSIYFAPSYCKVWKKSFEQILRYKNAYFGPQSGQNCLLSPKEEFFGNFTGVIFIYLLCPIMLQSLEIFLNVDLETKGCIILHHNWDKTAHLVQTAIFMEFHISNLCQLIVFYHAAEFQKISLRQILGYKLV